MRRNTCAPSACSSRPLSVDEGSSSHTCDGLSSFMSWAIGMMTSPIGDAREAQPYLQTSLIWRDARGLSCENWKWLPLDHTGSGLAWACSVLWVSGLGPRIDTSTHDIGAAVPCPSPSRLLVTPLAPSTVTSSRLFLDSFRMSEYFLSSSSLAASSAASPCSPSPLPLPAAAASGLLGTSVSAELGMGFSSEMISARCLMTRSSTRCFRVSSPSAVMSQLKRSRISPLMASEALRRVRAKLCVGSVSVERREMETLPRKRLWFTIVRRLAWPCLFSSLIHLVRSCLRTPPARSHSSSCKSSLSDSTCRKVLWWFHSGFTVSKRTELCSASEPARSTANGFVIRGSPLSEVASSTVTLSSPPSMSSRSGLWGPWSTWSNWSKACGAPSWSSPSRLSESCSSLSGIPSSMRTTP
mmetsp:Transcript_2913/g.7253  ORF Transcript_2913/g.7253 Transcript_2913/m.7253 type:complete len:412 (-) Transcript_2913:126-1361(-)